MTENFGDCILSVIVENKPTLCCPLTCTAFKKGNSLPLGKAVYPNNGLRSYSQFDEVVRLSINYDITFDNIIHNVVTLLQSHTSDFDDTKKEKKLAFLTRQLQLLSNKQFSMKDYCFALETYPKCSYEQLRDFLVLPSKRMLQYITTSVDKDKLLRETFAKIQTVKKNNVFLLVDEVQIRPTVAFSGRILSGMAENNPDCKAISMLGVMMKSLHKGPSLMISLTPVHKLTATYQFQRVKEAADAVERAGGVSSGLLQTTTR